MHLDSGKDIVAEFLEVFTDAPPRGCSQIELGFEVIPLQDGSSPVLRPIFGDSPLEVEEIQWQIDQLLALGPSASTRTGAPGSLCETTTE